MARARVYPSYKDPAESYLAEATASRGRCQDKPSVSPREWAQTAAVGIALRNAGFGLQFALAGEDFSSSAPDEFAMELTADMPVETPEQPVAARSETPPPPPKKELTFEEKLEAAMKQPCPISKYAGKTLGELVALDPKALVWITKKFDSASEIGAAAKLICNYALEATA